MGTLQFLIESNRFSASGGSPALVYETKIFAPIRPGPEYNCCPIGLSICGMSFSLRDSYCTQDRNCGLPRLAIHTPEVLAH